jgi:membrane associated rhomboid family serine protease
MKEKTDYYGTEGYNFSSKKDEINKIFNTPDYQEYKTKKRKTQKRKELTYKVTSIGNSTNSVKFLILSNTLIFILSYFFIPSLILKFASYNITNESFAIYQPFTSMFLHASIIHILFNMIMLWSFGNQLEQIIGTKKFLFIYFLSGLVSGILWMFFGTSAAVGASGALCGLLAAFVFISPESKVLLFFIIPVKIKGLVYGFALFSLVFGVLSMINPILGFGVGHFGHLGGLIGGYLIALYWSKRKLIPTT